MTSREYGSTSFEMRNCVGPREIYAQPCGRHWYSGSESIDASQDSARASPGLFNGRPNQSPIHGFSVLSCERTTVHSPEKSVCAKALPLERMASSVIRYATCTRFLSLMTKNPISYRT